MSEWLDNQGKKISSIGKLLQERVEKSNPRRKLTAEEAKRLSKLETIADRLRRGENVQNRLQKVKPQWKNCIRNPARWQYTGLIKCDFGLFG